MNAFADAAAALALDTNLSMAAVYRAPGGGGGVACRVIRYQRDPLADLGQHHVRQAGFVLSVRIAEVPAPARGGSLEVEGVEREIIDVQPDEDLLTHRVSVR